MEFNEMPHGRQRIFPSKNLYRHDIARSWLMIIWYKLNRSCMKCYVSEKEFLNFVKSQIFCQDPKVTTLFLF